MLRASNKHIIVNAWVCLCVCVCVVCVSPGSLQLWYHLLADQDPDVFVPIRQNLADGRLHKIRIHREAKDVYVQVNQVITPHCYAIIS